MTKTHVWLRWQGRTYPFVLDHLEEWETLSERIESSLKVPKEEQILKCCQKVKEQWRDERDVFVDLNLRVLGGKGGYGYLLRSGSSGVKKKKITNYSSCRNLEGRRIRDVEVMEMLEKANKKANPDEIDLGMEDEEEEEEDVEYETHLVNGKLKKKIKKKKKRKEVTETKTTSNEFQMNKEKEIALKKAKQKEVIENISEAIEEGLEKAIKEKEKPKEKEKVKKIYGDDMFESDEEEEDTEEEKE